MVIEEVGKKPNCITWHPGFIQVCLQRWSLQLAADKYKTTSRLDPKTGRLLSVNLSLLKSIESLILSLKTILASIPLYFLRQGIK